MAHVHTVAVPLDGTNDVTLTLPTQVHSVTVWADTATAQLRMRPGDGQDFVPLNNGAALALQEPGFLLTLRRLTLRSSTAITAYVMYVEPGAES